MSFGFFLFVTERKKPNKAKQKPEKDPIFFCFVVRNYKQKKKFTKSRK
jgi:hypothetical protein